LISDDKLFELVVQNFFFYEITMSLVKICV